MEFRFCPLCSDELVTLSSGPDRGRPACRSGHFVYYDNPAITAMAFVEREGRYLVLRRNQEPFRGSWEVPGGFLEPGESPGEGVVREIHEETGLRVKALSIIGAYTSRYGEGGKWTVDVAFHCKSSQSEVRLSAESSDVEWTGLEDLPQLAFAGERQALDELRRQLFKYTR
jgi:NAD+ diphosphatase